MGILHFMKRVNNITRKILLFMMFFFIIHDFMIGQTDIIANKKETLSTYETPINTVLTISEHHIFHAPFLLNADLCFTENEFIENSNYTLDTLSTKVIHTPLYTPPKYS